MSREKENKHNLFEEALNVPDTLDKTKFILKARAAVLAQERILPMSTNTTEVVIFKLGQEQFALESEYIQEIYSLKEVTTLPCTPVYVLGIINVRGQIVSIIDIKKFFGLQDMALTQSSKAIILYFKSLAFAILADEIIGTQSIVINDIQTSLSSFTGIRAAYLKGITANRLVILDAKKLIMDKKMVVHEQV
jgi:purine-binding chemotaxis protein CheW